MSKQQIEESGQKATNFPSIQDVYKSNNYSQVRSPLNAGSNGSSRLNKASSLKELNLSLSKSKKLLLNPESPSFKQNENGQPELGLLPAKQQKIQSLKNLYSKQSRILALQREEERLLKKIEIERKKADELQKVRQSHDSKLKLLQDNSLEREQRVHLQKEINFNRNTNNKLQIQEKSHEIIKSKKEIHNEVQEMKKQLDLEKHMFMESIQSQKLQNASLIKSQLMESRMKIEEYYQKKDYERKKGYLDRVKDEKKKKQKADKKTRHYEDKANEILERIKQSQSILGTIRHKDNSLNETRQSNML